MNFIKQIEIGLSAINQARFQDMINHLLHVQGKTFIAAPGSVVAKEKTSKGAPDSFFEDNGKFTFVECTTLERLGESKTFFNKMLKDVDHCFDEAKTGIKATDIGEVVLACTSTISAAEFKELSDRAKTFNSDLVFTVFDIQNLPMHIYGFPGLSEQYVGVTIVKGEIYNLPDFLQKTTKGLQPSLVNKFIGRTTELERADADLDLVDVLLLAGPAGVGKSKLAVAVLSAYAEKNGFIPIVIHSSAVPLWDDFVNLFQNGKDYIILFDDANKSVQNLSYLLDFIQKPKTNKLKVVITCRDYVKYQVEKKLADSRHRELTIDKLKDEDIREIVINALPALQHHPSIRHKIVDLAKGNARVALMAAYSAKPGSETNYLDSPLKLYEKYFEKVASEIDLFKNPIGLQALALVSFFGVFEHENTRIRALLENKLGIDWSELWSAIMELHSHEVLDVYAGDTAKVSDQVLATYAFYKCFLDPSSSVLNYSDWISEFITTHSSRLRTTLIDVNNTFNYEFVRDLVVPHLKRVSEGIMNKDDRYGFYKLFWFYQQMDTMVFLKQWVSAISPTSTVDSDLVFGFDANQFSRESEYFELITNFWGHNNELLKPSIELGFDLVAKEPERLPEFLKFLIDNFSYQWEDVQQGYGRQRVLIDFLSQQFDSDLKSEIADGVFVVLSKTLLGIHFTQYRPGRGHTYQYFYFDLPFSEDLASLRRQLLEGVMQRFSLLQEETWNILHKLKHPDGNFPRELTAAELPLYEHLVSEFLFAENYRDCRLVKRLAERLSAVGLEIPVAWDEYLHSEVMQLAKILKNEWDMPEGIGWEENFKLKQQEHENHIKGMSWPQIRKFLLRMDHFLQQPGLEQEWSLEGAATEVFIAIGKKGKMELLEALEMFFSSEVSFAIQSRLFNFILNNKWLTPAELLGTFKSREFPGQTFWSMAFLEALSEDQINLEYMELLVRCFRQTERKLNLHRFVDFLKFETCFEKEYKKVYTSKDTADHNIISFLLQLMLEKPDEMLALGFHFCSENAVHLTGQIDLLKNAYYRLKEKDKNFDHDGKELEAIIALDNEFIVEYLLQRSVNDNYLSFKFERFKLDCLWDLPEYKSIITRCMDIIIGKSPVFSNFSHGANTLFLRTPKTDEGKLKALEVFDSYIDSNFSDRQKMMMVGNLVLCNYPEEFIAFFKRLLLLNKDLDILKSIYFSVSISAVTGSLVPRMQRELQRVKDVQAMIRTLPDVLDYFEHIEYLDAKLGWVKKEIDEEYRRDFEDSLD